jgi:hypothetical protein
MNKNKKVLCVLLSLLFLTAPLGIAAFSIPGVIISDGDLAIPAADYDFSNRGSPIDILIYTEYSDLAAGGEWENTYDAILNTYGNWFNYENLTDYTQLASVIDEYDVFLIAEQETASPAESTTIGTAWQGILADFVSAGGILISLDGGTTEEQGGGKILNATNLLKTYNETLINTEGVGVVDSAHALAFDVSASFPAPNAAWAVDVDDATIVFEHSSSNKAFVAHKALGEGHVVYIGADLYSPGPDTQLILANAIRLTRHVVFDNSHGQVYSPLDSYALFCTDIVTKYGFAITTMNVWNPAVIEMCDIFVAANGGSSPISYNASEIDFIHGFVAGGGGLLILSDWGQWGNNTDTLLGSFGFARNYTAGYLADSDEYQNSVFQPIYGSGNIANHSTTVRVNSVQMFFGNAFVTVPADATPIVWTDSDGSESWSSGTSSAAGLTLAASMNFGAGRVFTLADCDFLTNGDNDSDATLDYLDEDNENFGAGVMVWLCAAGIPEKTMLFEQSRAPYYLITSTGLLEAARFFSFNGFNIRWVSQFSEELVSQSDVVVIFNTGQNYTTPELDYLREYVADGGSLFLLCDWDIYSTSTNVILAEFGMEVNGTSFLADTDDGYVDPPPSSYLVYEGANLADHPIMNGVSRIELDRSAGFSSIGGGVPLVITDDDGTSIWRNQTSTDNGAADAVPVVAATEFGFGRIVALPDINFIGTGDADSDMYPILYDADNDVFLANAMYWLVENRAPTVEVLFPNGGEVLNGTQIVEWTAVDFDSDPLTFDVYYSDNNGSDWSLLASGLSVLEYHWNTTQHDDGTSYMILVEVSDGMLGGQDTSDDPFELDNFVGGVPGFTLDPTLLLIIGAGVLVVIVLVVIVMKKKSGGT